jgi:hypothetical protein
MATAPTLDTAAHLSLQPRELPGRRFFSGITTYLSAIRDASAASHAYNELVRRGVPHDVAVERVFEEHMGGRR